MNPASLGFRPLLYIKTQIERNDMDVREPLKRQIDRH
jgi:hypothetical protein